VKITFTSLAVGLSTCFALQTAHAISTMPSSGSCAFLITQPVPLGITGFPFTGTGYNVLGTLNFSSATTGTISGVFVNVTYKTSDSPSYEHSAIFRDLPFTITAMTNSTGFSGGYILSASGNAYKTTAPTTPISAAFNFNMASVNSGKTLMMQMTGSGPGAGSGVCQF
jgi:hypothetical protein